MVNKIPDNNPDSSLNLSVVIPVFNEEESLPHLADKLNKSLQGLNKRYEVILVDDGSTDSSETALREICRKFPNFKTIRFRRNFGQTAAIAAGLDHAKGETIITLDADLQNDPEDIPKLLSLLNEGYDVVSGWRKNRKDTFLTRKVPSFIANWLIGYATGTKLHDYGCTLKAYKADVIKDVSLYGELHRFIPALASLEGAIVTEIPVTHHERKFGISKYNLSRTLRVILDLFTVAFLKRYQTRPIQIFGRLGALSFLLGFFISAYLSFEKIFFGASLANRPLLILGVLLILTGIQLLSLGLIAEMQIRTYFESQRKPIYRIREIIEQSNSKSQITNTK